MNINLDDGNMETHAIELSITEVRNELRFDVQHVIRFCFSPTRE